MSATFRRHAPGCIAEQAWDIPEAEANCTCSFPFPFAVCSECGNRLHQHKKECSRRPKHQAIPDRLSCCGRFFSSDDLRYKRVAFHHVETLVGEGMHYEDQSYYAHVKACPGGRK